MYLGIGKTNQNITTIVHENMEKTLTFTHVCGDIEPEPERS
jgi:hypothetical protein